jgi:hypothetical protein
MPYVSNHECPFGMHLWNLCAGLSGGFSWGQDPPLPLSTSELFLTVGKERSSRTQRKVPSPLSPQRLRVKVGKENSSDLRMVEVRG